MDGDDEGDRYAGELADPAAGARKVLCWPEGWTIEDVIGYIIAADEQPVIDRLGRDLAEAPGDLAKLTERLKSDDRASHGLKGDLVAYEIIANALTDHALCLQRARSMLHAVGAGVCRHSNTIFRTGTGRPGTETDIQTMAVTAFEGPAGTGKTYSLLERLDGDLKRRALASHERVLALTFMHCARRRLDLPPA